MGSTSALLLSGLLLYTLKVFVKVSLQYILIYSTVIVFFERCLMPNFNLMPANVMHPDNESLTPQVKSQ